MARRVEGHGGKGGSWRAEREPEGRGRPQRVEKALEGALQGEGDFRVQKVWPWVSGGSSAPSGWGNAR